MNAHTLAPTDEALYLFIYLFFVLVIAHTFPLFSVIVNASKYLQCQCYSRVMLNYANK